MRRLELLAVACLALSGVGACKPDLRPTCGQVLVAQPLPAGWATWRVVATSDVSKTKKTEGRGGHGEETDTVEVTVGPYTLKQTTSRGSPIHGDYLEISETSCSGDRLRYFLDGSTPSQPGWALGPRPVDLRQQQDDLVVTDGVRAAAAFTRRWNPYSR